MLAAADALAEPAGRAARWPTLRSGSGPQVARWFQRALAVIFLVAWVSLATQVRLLIGSRGLLPLDDFLAAATAGPQALSFWDFPTLLWLVHGDGVLVGGTLLGVALALAALSGRRPRLWFALSTVLYLSYATACRTFLSFQWDNLLLECGLLATFLPRDRAAPLVHTLFRLVLFKLYFESGIAKWQSPLSDWQDGSAMTFYYETAPLPTFLAFTAHHLPVWWHHLESRATLALELIVPLGIFGPRRVRLATAAALTAFQLLNIATANYGFFCYLALALHLFVLDDRRAAAPTRPPARHATTADRARRTLGWVGAALFAGSSLVEALFHFTDPGPTLQRLTWVLELNQRLRLINTYHLFAAITRERIEPEFQTLAPGADPQDAAAWQAQDLRWKAGAQARRPPFVAPHQPRVDFQLWFHGLGYQRRPPAYVAMLLERMCEDAPAVQSLFAAPLPPHPAAVRVVYWQYHFASRADARASHAWWRRDFLAAARPLTCAQETP